VNGARPKVSLEAGRRPATPGFVSELPVYPLELEAVGVKSPLPFTVPDFRAR